MTTLPIKQRKKIRAIISHLETYHSDRDALLFRFGINTGLRIGDLLTIRYSDIFGEDGNFKHHMIIVEQKRHKERKIFLNEMIRTHINRYLLDRPILKAENGYLFFSFNDPSIPIDRARVHQIFKKVERAVGLQNFASHTMRKTFGWHLWKKTGDPYLVMHTLGHTNLTTTKAYIGLDQADIDKGYKSIALG